MKKIAIITLLGHNYGNRLQNYAVQETIKSMRYIPVTILNNSYINSTTNSLKNKMRYVLSKTKNEIFFTGVYKTKHGLFVNGRIKNFINFNEKNINFSKKNHNKKNIKNYDYYIIGSDQVWNPYFGLDDFGFLKTIDCMSKKISFSASFGVDQIPKDKESKYIDGLKKIKSISVREDAGKKIVEGLTGRTDVEVLVDPTMLLTPEEWDKVSKKPKQIKDENKKYILNYFLGNLSESRKKEIERVAKENNCEIINLLDKKDPFYVSGPSEFLWLEKHAFLVCTDSFHSSVFAILYNRPFIVFNREQEGVENMGSRLDTLISKFKLKDRRYNGKCITKENLEHDYTESYKILEKEREKSKDFLERALDIKK